MKPSHHAVISASAGIGLALVLKSWLVGIACFIGGVAIDVDHFIDYYIMEKRLPQGISTFLDYYKKYKQPKMYIIFHSYEILVLFYVVGLYFLSGNLWIGFFVGMALHIFCDQMYNPVKSFNYFLVYRIRHDFKKEKLLKEELFK